ncbi:unnamed protein product [Adineta ricciae]|uniref:Uncharacterized protein n=1 Tax=Adineta ricciae TaxID=249248 RepID=A0A813SM90_ADIRI|nr:unnamed protein product [Adineta ricciae]
MHGTNSFTEPKPEDKRGAHNMKKLINDILTEKITEEHPMERRATPMGMTKEDSREINEILESSPPMVSEHSSIKTPTGKHHERRCCGHITDTTTDRPLKLFGIVGAGMLALIAFIIVFIDCWIDGTRLYLEEAVVYRVFQVKEADSEAMALNGSRLKNEDGEKEKPPLMLSQQQAGVVPYPPGHYQGHNHPVPYLIPAYVYYPTMVPGNHHLFHGHGHNHGHRHGHNHNHGHPHDHGHDHSHRDSHDHADSHSTHVPRYRHYPETNRSLSHLTRHPRRIHTVSSTSSQRPIGRDELRTSNPTQATVVNPTVRTSDKSMPVIKTRKVIQKPRRVSQSKVKINDAVHGTHIDQLGNIPTTAITYDNIPPNVTEVIRETTVVKAPRSLLPTLRKTLVNPNNDTSAIFK